MNNEAKLGTVPKGDEGRDAVHVAIVPVRAAESLAAGWPVKMNATNEAVACHDDDEAIGVVDPFRPLDDRPVAKGSWFWLCLYPKTITGLRHVWEHPSLPVTLPPSTPAADKAVSETWLKAYVSKHCEYWDNRDDKGYGEFLAHVQCREIFYYGSDCYGLDDVYDADELFHHLGVVLGKRIDASYFETFTCSC
jgi:hypothetical protein